MTHRADGKDSVWRLNKKSGRSRRQIGEYECSLRCFRQAHDWGRMDRRARYWAPFKTGSSGRHVTRPARPMTLGNMN